MTFFIQSCFSFLQELRWGRDWRKNPTDYLHFRCNKKPLHSSRGRLNVPIWWPLIRKTEEQWDQIWFFRKVLISDFLTKVAQTLSNFWVYLENCHFWSKHCFGYFWELFWKIGLLFIAKSGRTYGGFPYDDVTACPIIDFLFFNTNFIEENCRLQWDSNSDRPNKRKVHWLGTRPPQCNIKIQCQL